MFVKGQSGNPSGRPKKVNEIKLLAQQHCVKAIDRLVELLDSKDERTALQAANALLDRGIGKPVQAVAGADGEGPVLARVERVIVDLANTAREDDAPHVTH